MGHPVQLKQNPFYILGSKNVLQNEHEKKFIVVIMSQTSVIKEYQSPSPFNDIMITFNVHVFIFFVQ